MAYRAGLPLVLRGVSLQLAPGEKLGVCGRTGAGKSSLLVALFRLAELHAGAIRVDGVDIARVPLAALRARLAIIAQEPTLFTGTLRSNLDPLGHHADAALLAALEQCHLLPLALGHPSGLGRAIDERGANLSTGQRQLVCIARALLRHAKVGARGGSPHLAGGQPQPPLPPACRQSTPSASSLTPHPCACIRPVSPPGSGRPSATRDASRRPLPERASARR
jgi:ABC-type hemin transport system ATPase subunit